MAGADRPGHICRDARRIELCAPQNPTLPENIPLEQSQRLSARAFLSVRGQFGAAYESAVLWGLVIRQLNQLGGKHHALQ